MELTVKCLDYFCAPHVEAGIWATYCRQRHGPGALPFDYDKSQGHNWKPVPPAAQRTLPTIETILAEKTVRSPLDFSKSR